MRLLSGILGAMLAGLALPALAQEKSGVDVYEAVCSECHGSGKHDAPRLGDRKRWGKLVREGLDDLVPAALRGLRKMPALGGNPQLSDLEVARAVVYIANAGGGKFAEPTAADAARWRKKAGARK
ncbi:MAG: c-type cytochrome [Dechloromonas sp.]|nr:c-type cytochrome [Dechloromonas sp.]